MSVLRRKATYVTIAFVAGTLLSLVPIATAPVSAATVTVNAASGLGPIVDGGDGEVPDYGPARNVLFNVSGFVGTVADLAVTFRFEPDHTWVGDLDVRLFAPGGSSAIIFSLTGSTSFGADGFPTDLDGPYTFTDSSSKNWWTAAPSAIDDNLTVPEGSYRTTAPGGAGQTDPAPVTNLNAAFSGLNPNGTWRLQFRDGAIADEGSVQSASLTISDVPPPDDDADGVPNPADECPGTPALSSVHPDGCVVDPTDPDADDVPDNDTSDKCPNSPFGEAVDANGCARSQFRPDATIKRSNRAAVIGDGTRNTNAVGQTLTAKIRRRKSVTYQIAVQNDNASTTVTDRYDVFGCAGSRGFRVSYTNGAGSNITTAVVEGSYRTPSVAPGQAALVNLRIKVKGAGPKNKICLVTVTSVDSPGSPPQDAVAARVKVKT